jgi:hypothetical protein
MLRIILVCGLALAGCTGENGDSAEEAAEEVPIGPGSDSSALIPPDTPMTRRTPGTGTRPPGMPDTVPTPLTTR